MRYLTMLLLIPALLLVIGSSSKSGPGIGTIEVLVTAGTVPLLGASVAIDLNNNGVWDEHLGEPRGWTDANGLVVFSDVVSVQQPGGDDQSDIIDWQPTRLMLGNVRGSVGASDVQVDFVLPSGSGTASFGLYDLRGRRLAQTHGPGDLVLSLPRALPSGVYFLRLSAEPAAPVSQKITSVGVKTQTIRANKVAAAEAVAAGWTDYRPPTHGKSQKSEDPPHHINLIVEHDDYATVVQPEIIVPGINYFTVVLEVVPEGFIYISPGTFIMGSPEDEPGYYYNQGPEHQVTLTKGFYMSKYEVTEAWWYQVMGGTPTTSQLPKDFVSWDMAVEFCNTLSLQEGLIPAYTIHGPNGDVTWHQDADGYRLPTEAEREYACRATTTLAFNNNTNCLSSDTEANYDGNWPLTGCPAGDNRGERTVVGSFPANQWGLYDMHGNMYEWVWCGLRTYMSSPQEDPVYNVGPGGYRVVRGGCWVSGADGCRSAGRGMNSPSFSSHNFGFRPVRSVFPDDPQFDTIHIDPQPSGLNAPWELTGPDNYLNEGSGSATLTDMAPGNYTIAWGGVDGYFTPSSESQELIADGAITFTGAYSIDYTNCFTYISPGTFMMGSPSNEPGRQSNEGPQHQVNLTQGFYMSKYEMTEEWWYQVMGGTPTTSQLPKNYVSWDMAVEFCNALSLQEGLTPAYTIGSGSGNVTWDLSASGYRLPTEAEWEYACRATTTFAYNNNTNCLSSDTEANYHGSFPLTGCPTGVYRGERTVVGSFPANQWGLYDMHGNMYEWVWCGLRTYTSSPQEDPVYNVGPGAYRVVRGGSWLNYAQYCRSAYRYFYAHPHVERYFYGFRPVRSAP